VPFDLLLREADIIFLHMPFTTDAYQILGKEEFERMKQGIYIVNTSSVELIDLEALYENLKKKKVKGAALDILESDYTTGRTQELGNETMSTKLNNKITENLLKMPNVIITPHIAYNTVEYIDWVLETTMNSLKDFIKGNNTNKIC
jgi:phosphoglycerate dehydrogenase-like enzyme